jgi:hypothetical protein
MNSLTSRHRRDAVITLPEATDAYLVCTYGDGMCPAATAAILSGELPASDCIISSYDPKNNHVNVVLCNIHRALARFVTTRLFEDGHLITLTANEENFADGYSSINYEANMQWSGPLIKLLGGFGNKGDEDTPYDNLCALRALHNDNKPHWSLAHWFFEGWRRGWNVSFFTPVSSDPKALCTSIDPCQMLDYLADLPDDVVRSSMAKYKDLLAHMTTQRKAYIALVPNADTKEGRVEAVPQHKLAHFDAVFVGKLPTGYFLGEEKETSPSVGEKRQRRHAQAISTATPSAPPENKELASSDASEHGHDDNPLRSTDVKRRTRVSGASRGTKAASRNASSHKR